jgi:predicted lipoprotein
MAKLKNNGIIFMNYKKFLIYIFSIICLIFLLWQSVYFEKLTQKKQKDTIKNFNPKQLVDYFWLNILPELSSNALLIETFDSLINFNKNILFDKYGNSIGISSNYCFLVKGKNRIINVSNENAFISVSSKNDYYIKTKFIFSNTARDASGFFKLDDFQNSMDFNAVSSELNNRIMNEVDKIRSNLKNDCIIEFVGAVEINLDIFEENKKNKFEIIPFAISILK